MIEASGLSRTYGTHTVWHDLDLRCPDGSITALTGASGSGKSTLLNCLGCLDRPSTGSILVDGMDIAAFSRRRQRRYRRHTVGYLFQDYALITDRSVAHNLRLAIPRSDYHRIPGALEEVGLAGYAARPVFELSGGEQQRVALARVLVRRPPLVLADEPTGALDPGNGAMVIAKLRDLADAGATVVVATHEPAVAAAADTLVRLGVA